MKWFRNADYAIQCNTVKRYSFILKFKYCEGSYVILHILLNTIRVLYWFHHICLKFSDRTGNSDISIHTAKEWKLISTTNIRRYWNSAQVFNETEKILNFIAINSTIKLCLNILSQIYWSEMKNDSHNGESHINSATNKI